MELIDKLNILDRNYGIEHLFSPGLYHRFESVERTYMDIIELDGKELFEYLNKFLLEKLKPILKLEYLVCLVTYTDDENSIESELSEDIIALNKTGIYVPKENIYLKRYIEEDEWFAHYFFFKDEASNLSKYISGSMACNFDLKLPYFQFEVFYLDKTLQNLIHIYDDRGMDVMKLHCK